MDMIPRRHLLKNRNLPPHFNQAPVSIEKLQSIERWLTNELCIGVVCMSTEHSVQTSLALNLPRIQEFDDRWIALASRVYGLSQRELRNYVALGRNNALLAILIHVTRQAILNREWKNLEPLAEFDIRDTLPGLQHGFCTLWNELVQEAPNQGPYSLLIYILRSIRHLYFALHQGTDAAPTAFTASTVILDSIQFQPLSYPLCDISNHPDSTVPVPVLTRPGDSSESLPHHSTLDRSTVSIQVKKASIVAGPPLLFNLTTPGEIGDPQPPAATSSALPVFTSPRPTNATPPGAVATAPQDFPLATTMYHPPEGTTWLDTVEPCVEPDISEILPTLSILMPTPTQAPTPLFATPVLNKSSASRDESAASNPLLPALSVVNSSIPASPPPSCVVPLLDAEALALVSSTTPSRPTGNDPRPRLRARGLVNTGSMCFANAVLQLLVRSPPFWNLLRELGDLEGHRGERGPETDGCATPLLDATRKLFGEFVSREEPPPAQQPPQQAAEEMPKGDEEAKKMQNVVDPFEPSYMYDVMEGKRQLKGLLVCSRATQHPAITDVLV